MPSQAEPPITLSFNQTACLTLPVPQPSAVQAALFGVSEEGGLCPSPEEIAALVQEHLYDLVDLTLRIDGYIRSEKTGCHPDTGPDSLSGKQRQANRQRAANLLKEARILRMAQYDVYEQAFGHEARIEFQAFVDKVTASVDASHDPSYSQRELF